MPCHLGWRTFALKCDKTIYACLRLKVCKAQECEHRTGCHGSCNRSRVPIRMNALCRTCTLHLCTLADRLAQIYTLKHDSPSNGSQELLTCGVAVGLGLPDAAIPSVPHPLIFALSNDRFVSCWHVQRRHAARLALSIHSKTLSSATYTSHDP
jgi:hypothetical protein